MICDGATAVDRMVHNPMSPTKPMTDGRVATETVA